MEVPGTVRVAAEVIQVQEDSGLARSWREWWGMSGSGYVLKQELVCHADGLGWGVRQRERSPDGGQGCV